MRRRPYAIHTERAYCDWTGRFARYHGMKGRQDIQRGQGVPSRLDDLDIYLVLLDESLLRSWRDRET